MTVLNRIRKLRRMNGAEVLHRVGVSLTKLRDRRRWKRNSKRKLFKDCDAASLLSNCGNLVPGTHSEQRTALGEQQGKLHNDLKADSVRAATAICDGSLEMLGCAFDLRGEINWHQDPRSEFRWERSFYADLQLSGLPNGVDVKYVWELARHQFVVELARGWLLTGDDQFSKRARGIVLSWIADNPLYEGVHWTSGLEVAMRAISWIWTLATLAGWDGWREDDLQSIGRSLSEHADYLQNHFSFYSSPFNHLIGEATALYLIGHALNERSESAGWKQRGLDVLGEHGPRQFYADGFCVEQATGYHFYTLGFLLMAVAAARQAGEPLADLEPVVHKAALAGAAFRKPDGRWPAIGDVDSARSIPVHHDDFWRFDSLCNLAATLFDDAKLKTDVRAPGAEIYWLLGSEGVEHWSRLESQPACAHLLLKDSGYVIASDEENWLLFDAGPVAGGLFADSTPSTAHGHADTLQVLYFADGRPLLHDGGMPFYNGDAEWVRHFRSAAAHNTLEIQGCEYVRSVGRLAWSHEVQRPTVDADFSDDAWLARGRMEWPGVGLERHLLCLPGQGLWIADWIRSEAEREAHWFWQVPSAKTPQIETTADGGITIPFEEFKFEVTSSTGRVDAWHQSPDSTRPEGWRCTGYGTRTAASRLVVRRVVAGETVVLTAIAQPTAHVEVQLETLESDVVGTGFSQSNSSVYQSGTLRWIVRTTQGQHERFPKIEQATIIHDEIAR